MKPYTSRSDGPRLAKPARSGPSAGGSASLRPDRLRRLYGCLWIKVPAARPLRPEIRADVIEQRDSGRDVQLGDVRVPDAVQVLDQGAQRVAVRNHEHGPARGEIRDNRVVPVRQHPFQDVLEALRARPEFLG